MSTGGGITPRWRYDGQELFYVAPDNRMMVEPIHVAADGRTVSAGAPVALFASRLTTGNTGSGGFASRAQYAVAPIPRSYLWVVPNGAHGPVFGDAAAHFVSTALGFLRGEWSRSV